MLSFFFTRHQLPTIQTENSTRFELLSTQKFKGKVIPFSHIYLSSPVYLRKIKKTLGEEHKAKVVNVEEAHIAAIKSDPRFPIEFSSLGGFEKLQEKVRGKKEIHIAVVNGIGTGFGDNYVGLGAMQRLAELLAPVKVYFHLMQSMNDRFASVYMRDENIFVHNYFMSIKQFMTMDFYINLSGMLGFPSFDKLPLSQFMASQFLVKDVSSQEQLQPSLKLDQIKLNIIKLLLERKLEDKKPTVLFHPQASSPIRTMNKKVADKFIAALVEQGFNVVIAIPYSYKESKNVCNVSSLSKNIDDFLHVAKVCDSTISVGTVLYHLTAAMQKPTMLLPTVKADVDSGTLLKTVNVWVPKQNEQFILNKHKGRSDEDMATVSKIWANMDEKEIARKLFNTVLGS